MSKDLFKNLIEAVVALAADEVVNLLDSKRETVADAAQFLHCDHGFTANWLRHHEAISITRYAGDLRAISRERVAMMCLFELPVFQADSFGVIMNGELYELSGDGWSFRKKWPNREKTADAAQYLWKNQHSGDWVSLLQRFISEEIRSTASNRQKHLCTKVADAAWIAFDEGGYRDVLKTLGSERIQDFATEAKSWEVRKVSRKMLGVLNIEGYGKHGQRVKIQGAPVYDPFAFTPESELVKATAKAHGITSVTDVSFSWGPGIHS